MDKLEAGRKLDALVAQNVTGIRGLNGLPSYRSIGF